MAGRCQHIIISRILLIVIAGMVPWLLIIELLSTSGLPLSKLVKEQFEAFPSSGENNFTVEDADAAIETVLQIQNQTRYLSTIRTV